MTLSQHDEHEERVSPVPAFFEATAPLHVVGVGAAARAIAREYLLIAGGIWLGAAAWSWQGDGSFAHGLAVLCLTVLSVLATGVGQHRLSGLGHEAAHRTLLPGRQANDWTGELLLLLPLCSSLLAYRRSHLSHHLYVNDAQKDGDLLRLQASGGVPRSRQDYMRTVVWGGLWPPRLVRYAFGRFRAANSEGAEPRWRGAIRVAIWLGLIAASWRGNWLSELAVLWFLPLLTVFPYLMQLRELPHHVNAPPADPVRGSRIFRVHPVFRYAIYPYGQDWHATHHLLPRIPCANLPEAHARLMGLAAYRDRVEVCEGMAAVAGLFEKRCAEHRPDSKAAMQ